MDSKALRDVIRSRHRERRYVEETQLGGILIPLIKLCGFKVIIYGCEIDTPALLNYLLCYDVVPEAIFDRDEDKVDRLIYDIRICPIYKLDEFENQDDVFVIINIHDFACFKAQDVTSILQRYGLNKYYVISEPERSVVNSYSVSWHDKGRGQYYIDHEEELIQTYKSLLDSESRQTMCEYIRTYMESGVYSLHQIDGKYKYFYGETDGKATDLYIHRRDEIWINCGANIGDSIFLYFALGLTCKRILAYEANKSAFLTLKRNIDYLPDRFKNIVVSVNEYIDENTDFEKFLNVGERVSLINADIEGSEQELVRKLSQRIIKDRPVLALCAYHRADDLTELPKLIRDIVDDYVFVLRKYEASPSNISRNAEIVLYAIPKERSIKV